jgi:hypothetical protein
MKGAMGHITARLLRSGDGGGDLSRVADMLTVGEVKSLSISLKNSSAVLLS